MRSRTSPGTRLEPSPDLAGRQDADLHGDRGLSPNLREVNRQLPVGEGVIGRVAASGETFFVMTRPAPSTRSRPRSAAVKREGVRGFVCVPITSRGRILGTLSLGRQTDAAFNAGEVALLEATADQIGIALDNARLYSGSRAARGDEDRAGPAGPRREALRRRRARVRRGARDQQPSDHHPRSGLPPARPREHHPYVHERLSIIGQETSARRASSRICCCSRGATCRSGGRARSPSRCGACSTSSPTSSSRTRSGVVTDFAPARPVWADENRSSRCC